jgi:hypothetical protein
MFILAYICIALTGVLIIGAGVAATRDRTLALGVIVAALVTGITAAVTTAIALGGGIGPKGYRAVREAAAQDPEVDAVAQWVLADNMITPAEYGQVADTYRDKTGRELNDLAR